MMVQRKELQKVVAIVQTYKTLVSSSVSTTGELAKVLGTVLHVSKAKKVSFTAKIGEKKMKRDVAYYRMMFCR